MAHRLVDLRIPTTPRGSIWRDQAYTTRTVTRTLTAGPHRITLEYYENGGLAQATLTWT